MTEGEMIQDALDTWREINADPYRWASFEAVRFKHETRCAIKWGAKYFGRKEQPIQTIVYTLYDTGNYTGAVRLTHF